MITLRTRVKDGKLSTSVNKEIKIFLDMMEGKEIELVLKKARSKRTDRANRYYFGCVVPIVCAALKDLGHTLNKVECHEWLKMTFNYTSLADGHGNHIADIPRSTTELTKTEFGEYIERIAQWCAEILDIVIPAPNEQTHFEFNHN
jgi:hypothetical protein